MMKPTTEEVTEQIAQLRARAAAYRGEGEARRARIAEIGQRMEAITRERVALQDEAGRLGAELQTNSALAGQAEQEGFRLAAQAAALEATGA